MYFFDALVDKNVTIVSNKLKCTNFLNSQHYFMFMYVHGFDTTANKLQSIFPGYTWGVVISEAFKE